MHLFVLGVLMNHFTANMCSYISSLLSTASKTKHNKNTGFVYVHARVFEENFNNYWNDWLLDWQKTQQQLILKE